MLNRMVLIKIHVLVAAFVLPVAMMFFMTGALYTWGVKGDYDVSIYKIELKEPLQQQVDYLVDIVKEELQKKAISLPTGQAKIKKIGAAFQLEWTGSDKDIILEASATPLVANLKVKETSWHRYLVQLHKAKGGVAFKIYALVLAIFLIGLFITGFIMAWQIPKLQRMLINSTLLGVLTFLLVIFYS